MQFEIPHLKVGQEVQADVREIFENGDALVSLSGDLLRIRNHSRNPFRLGETITLQVMAIQPLAFKWLGNMLAFSRGLDKIV